MGKYTVQCVKWEIIGGGQLLIKNYKHWFNIFEDKRIPKTPIGIESYNCICA